MDRIQPVAWISRSGTLVEVQLCQQGAAIGRVSDYKLLGRHLGFLKRMRVLFLIHDDLRMPVLAVKIETSQSAQVSRAHHNGWILRIELPGNDSLTAEGERDKALPNERHARFYPTRSGNDNPAQSEGGSPPAAVAAGGG
ncbi:hypothetical protein BLA39750_01175 [Burkholderia lata]|uniref:Uncharacterized protein n=1 Tax=Burkholderia lata (strain ATCC 17760 / DSM 23089 / LMG 22485 / NCIMB 9086 / R18194 / 383) TaxID=482957 RepID=A0A6P2VAG7_BURL3|nr:hypothetical protein BLA39750_01175 [Burkholderia lata]